MTNSNIHLGQKAQQCYECGSNIKWVECCTSCSVSSCCNERAFPLYRLPHSISLSTTYRQRIPVSERKIELPLLPHGSLSPLSILLWQAGSKALSLNIEMSLKVLKVTPAPCLPQSHSNILTIWETGWWFSRVRENQTLSPGCLINLRVSSSVAAVHSVLTCQPVYTSCTAKENP